MDEEYHVLIVRQPNRYTNCGEICIDRIFDVHWDNLSGGYRVHQPGYSLYGYISYSDAMRLVDCSGRHDEYNNDVKICIPKSMNTGKYRKGYLELCRQAGEKPKSSKPRVNNGIPCTKTILGYIEAQDNKTVARGILRKYINECGFASKQLSRALYSLQLQNKVACPGDGRDPSQQISLMISNKC